MLNAPHFAVVQSDGMPATEEAPPSVPLHVDLQYLIKLCGVSVRHLRRGDGVGLCVHTVLLYL